MTATYKEYAEALFMLACERDALDGYGADLELVADVLRDESEYLDLLSCPSVPVLERENALKAAFEGKISEDVLSLLCILCARGRIRETLDCIKEYKKLLTEYKKVKTAVIYSPCELSADEKQRLKEKLEGASGYSVSLDCRVDSAMLGGMVVEFDGKVMDGSVKARLQEVKDVISR